MGCTSAQHYVAPSAPGSISGTLKFDDTRPASISPQGVEILFVDQAVVSEDEVVDVIRPAAVWFPDCDMNVSRDGVVRIARGANRPNLVVAATI
jgi:hypothetical protein